MINKNEKFTKKSIFENPYLMVLKLNKRIKILNLNF